MTEYYFPEAVVLDREPANEMDSRFFIYAKGFGKIIAKAKSARKITSKLSAHLEPGNLVQVKLVEKNGPQAIDALKRRQIGIKPVDLCFLNHLLPEADFDFGIWEELISSSSGRESSKFYWPKILKILGWDPEYALCGRCHKEKPSFFNVADQGFFCKNCFCLIPESGSLKNNLIGL